MKYTPYVVMYVLTDVIILDFCQKVNRNFQ